MTSIRKGFVFCTFLVVFWAIIGVFSDLLENPRFAPRSGMLVFLFIGFHLLFFLARMHNLKKRRIISFVPSFLPGFFMIIFFYQWIVTEAYLGCPVTDVSCEDTLSPALFISAVVFLSSVLYSTFFELSLRHSNPKMMQVDPLKEGEIVDQTTEEKENTSVPGKTDPKPIIFRKYAIQGGIVVGGGVLAFGLVYVIFSLIYYLNGLVPWERSEWITAGIYAFVLSILTLFSQRTKWSSSVKAALIISPIIIWMSMIRGMGNEINSQAVSEFGTIFIVTGAFCYAYFTKKPWQYYLAIAFSALLGLILLK